MTLSALSFHLAQKQTVVTEHKDADMIGCAAYHADAVIRLRHITSMQGIVAARPWLQMLHRFSEVGGAALSQATHCPIRLQQAVDHRQSMSPSQAWMTS